MHGHSYAYRVAGSGPALLLVHGIAGDADNWREVIEPLARDHTVIVPDLPGHGSSGHGGGDYSLGAMATALRDLLVAIEVERVTIVGHSLGAGSRCSSPTSSPSAASAWCSCPAAGWARR